MYKVLIAVIMGLVLAGCSTTPKVITETKIIKVKINPVLLEPCYITPIFDKEKYLSSTDEERELLYVNYIVDLHKDLGKCNKQILEIKKGNDHG